MSYDKIKYKLNKSPVSHFSKTLQNVTTSPFLFFIDGKAAFNVPWLCAFGATGSRRMVLVDGAFGLRSILLI